MEEDDLDARGASTGTKTTLSRRWMAMPAFIAEALSEAQEARRREWVFPTPRWLPARLLQLQDPCLAPSHRDGEAPRRNTSSPPAHHRVPADR